MKLFPEDPTINLLPFQGEVNYYGVILPREEAARFYETLLNEIEWQNDEAVIFGKRIVTARKVAWYANNENGYDYPYRYSGTTKYALNWTPELLELKQLVEKKTGETFNSCLLNLYHNGSEGMVCQSDGETELKKNGAIASLSLGAERKFAFKHKRDSASAKGPNEKKQEVVSLLLEHGSLLVMKGQTQTYWMHRLPPTKKVHSPRINLTFRTMNIPKSDKSHNSH